MNLRALLLVPVLMAACTSPSPRIASSSPSPSASPSAVPAFDRVVIVVMENREYDGVIGNSQAPYVNRLAHRFALATRFYATAHPSLPNYLALVGGSTFGIDSDCTDCSVQGRNLVDQLEAHHLSWKAYMQGMPGSCYKGASRGRYAKKHDPFMYFDDIRTNARRCHKIVRFQQLVTDETNGALPRFVWITPDLCHDGHDCSLATADLFLKNHVPALLRTLGSDGVLFLTWDEGSSDAGCCKRAHGGHVVTVVAGPGAARAKRAVARFDHYSILRTIEESWGLRLLRGAACTCTRSMTAMLR